MIWGKIEYPVCLRMASASGGSLDRMFSMGSEVGSAPARCQMVCICGFNP